MQKHTDQLSGDVTGLGESCAEPVPAHPRHNVIHWMILEQWMNTERIIWDMQAQARKQKWAVSRSLHQKQNHGKKETLDHSIPDNQRRLWDYPIVRIWVQEVENAQLDHHMQSACELPSMLQILFVHEPSRYGSAWRSLRSICWRGWRAASD